MHRPEYKTKNGALAGKSIYRFETSWQPGVEIKGGSVPLAGMYRNECIPIANGFAVREVHSRRSPSRRIDPSGRALWVVMDALITQIQPYFLH